MRNIRGVWLWSFGVLLWTVLHYHLVVICCHQESLLVWKVDLDLRQTSFGVVIHEALSCVCVDSVDIRKLCIHKQCVQLKNN